MPEEAGVSKKELVTSTMRNKYEYILRGSIGDTKFYNKNILLYSVLKEFLSNRYPIRIVVLMLPAQAYYNILQDVTPDKPYANVKLDVLCKYDADKSNTHIQQYVLNGEYFGVLDKTYVNPNILHDDDLLDNVYKLRVALFNKSDLELANKGTVSGFFNNITVEGLIKHAFDRCKSSAESRIVISAPDNTNVIPNVAIRPNGFFQFLDYIEHEYGMYEGGYNAFVENGVCFILNKNKSDLGLGDTYAGSEDDKITIRVISSNHPNPQMLGVYKTDGQLAYVVYDNNLVTTETTNDTVMTPIDVCINSNYSTITSPPVKYEGISDSIYVSETRQRSIPKSTRNPKFKANIKIVGLPMDIKPYTVVRFVSSNCSGDCLVSKFSTYWSYGTFVNEITIVSYDELFEFNMKESKKYNNI